tara:strand:+ start:427 stop:1710 length:1284 start_codon:yes stop_codon:yes gene_type:complete
MSNNGIKIPNTVVAVNTLFEWNSVVQYYGNKLKSKIFNPREKLAISCYQNTYSSVSYFKTQNKTVISYKKWLEKTKQIGETGNKYPDEVECTVGGSDRFTKGTIYPCKIKGQEITIVNNIGCEVFVPFTGSLWEFKPFPHNTLSNPIPTKEWSKGTFAVAIKGNFGIFEDYTHKLDKGQIFTIKKKYNSEITVNESSYWISKENLKWFNTRPEAVLFSKDLLNPKMTKWIPKTGDWVVYNNGTNTQPNNIRQLSSVDAPTLYFRHIEGCIDHNNIKNYRKARPDEIPTNSNTPPTGSSLIKEATERYPIGTKVISLFNDERTIKTNKFELNIERTKVYADGGHTQIYEDGKWATVLTESFPISTHTFPNRPQYSPPATFVINSGAGSLTVRNETGTSSSLNPIEVLAKKRIKSKTKKRAKLIVLEDK